MAALNVQTVQNTGSQLLPQDQVLSDDGSLFSFSNLSIYNTDASQAYSLNGNLKIAKIQSQSSTANILTSNQEIVQIFTLSNNFSAVHKINNVAIQWVVTNSYSSPISFTSALSCIRYIEILMGGSTIATINAVNVLEELMYLNEDQLVPVCKAMGMNYIPGQSFTEGFVLSPGQSRVLTYPIFCPIINKLFLPVVNEQVSYRIHWAPQNNFLNSPISTALSSTTANPNVELPSGGFTTTAYTSTTGAFQVDGFNLMVAGWQWFGATYDRIYSDHLGKTTFAKILIPRNQIAPLPQVPAPSLIQNTYQLSVLSGKFISLTAWVNSSDINSNVTFASGATGVGYYVDNYNTAPAGSGNAGIYQTQLIATPRSLAAGGSSGVFPTYLIPNKKAGMAFGTATLLDSSGTPVLGTQQIPVEYQTEINALINRSPLLSILPVIQYSFDVDLWGRYEFSSYLSYVQTNGLFTLNYSFGPNYSYTGISGQVNQNTACSIYISAHQLGLATINASGAITIVNL